MTSVSTTIRLLVRIITDCAVDEIWHLVGSCGWFIDTVSAILRECVILDNARKDEKNTQPGTASNSTGPHPVLPKVTVDSTDKNKDSTMNGQCLTCVAVGEYTNTGGRK